MAKLLAFFAATLLLSTFFCSVVAEVAKGPPCDPHTGKILCISPNSPNVCQVRVTWYAPYQNLPTYHQSDYPFNKNLYADGQYKIWIDVFDGNCNFIGMAVGNEWGHVSITSELPWTSEAELPRGFPNMFTFSGWYAGQAIWPSTNMDVWIYAEYPWPKMMTALFGFHC